MTTDPSSDVVERLDALQSNFSEAIEMLKARDATIERLSAELARKERALEPFAALARPKTWPDAPGETGPSQIDVIEGKDGTGELYLGTSFGTMRKITLWRDDFERALAALSNTAENG